MPWPVPAPGVIAGNAAAIFEQQLPGIDARNPNTVATTICRVTEMAMQDLYFFQANVAKEMMPDTAVAALPRFGNMWDVPQTPASTASGFATVTGAAGTPIPAGTVMTYPNSSVTWSASAAVTIATGMSTASVPVVASAAGIAGNLAAGSILTLAAPIAGLTSLNATVGSGGLTGGAPVESTAAWQREIVDEIRDEPAGGSYSDYVKWAYEALPDVALAACPPGACGGSTVSVVIAMTGLVAPTSGQIAAVLAYIDALRPVNDVVTVYGVALNPVNVTLHVNPDTTAIQTAAAAALALSFAQDATIGGTTYVSRLSNAVSSSDGEYSHEMTAPAADVAAPTLFSLNILGTVTFT